MLVRARLAKLLDERSWRPSVLAARLGEHRNWVNDRLTGRIQIKADELPRIAAALGISPCDFFGVPPEEHPSRPRGMARTRQEFMEREAERSQGPGEPSYADIVTQELVRGWQDLPEEDQELVWQFVEARRQLKERLEREEGTGEERGGD